MVYRAVGNRCAVDFDLLQLPTSKEETLSLLRRKNINQVTIDLIGTARALIGTSRYRRGARLREAPGILDCSSLIKWVYGQRGVWLPRRSIQQREMGIAIQKEEILAGDAVFVSGCIDYYLIDPSDGVGHVGIATDNDTVIHAANAKTGIAENSLKGFWGESEFRGARRYIPNNRDIVTLEFPLEREIETSDDIRWIVLQSLGRS